jgi:hypothetical protein
MDVQHKQVELLTPTAHRSLRGKGMQRATTFHSSAMSAVRGTIKHVGETIGSGLTSIEMDSITALDEDDDAVDPKDLIFTSKIAALVNSMYPPVCAWYSTHTLQPFFFQHVCVSSSQTH